MSGSKKQFYDRVIGQLEVKWDGHSVYGPVKPTDNHVGRKKDSFTTKERPWTSSTNAPNPHVENWPAHGAGGVVAGAKETGVEIPPAGSPESAVEAPIGGPARGFSDDMGNYISVQGDGSLLLSHTSGAYVTIKPDGAVYVTAMGDKGINLVSGKGGIGIHSQGQIVFDSQSSIIMNAKGAIGLHTEGAYPLTLDAGGDILTKAGGSSMRQITGSDTSFVGGSKNDTVFGNADYQVQGISKLGSATQMQIDSPKTNVGASEQLVMNSEGTAGLFSKDYMTLQSQDMIGAMAKSDMTLTSKKSMNIVGDTGASLDSLETVSIRGKNINLDGGEKIQLDTKDLELNATNMTLQATQVMELDAGSSLKLSSKGSLDIDSDSAMNLAGSTIDLNSRSPQTVQPANPRVTSPRTAPAPKKVEESFKDDKYEGDNFYSKEDFQKMNKNWEAQKQGFPYSDYTMSGDDYNALKNNGGQLPSGAEQNASEKQNVGSQVSDGESYGTLDPGTSDNYSVAREPDMAPPTSSNPADPVGMYSLDGIPGVENIPGDGQCGTGRDEIIKNLMHLNENIAKPLIANHPDVRPARGFLLKYDNNCSNPHYKGLAIDFVVSNKRDQPRLVQVAYWAARKLPCKVVRIEKTLSHSYLHIEAAEAGQTGQNCTVETCNDVEGKSKTSGLVLRTNEYKDAQLSTRSKDPNKKPTWIDEG